jgi:hypothetical protein
LEATGRHGFGAAVGLGDAVDLAIFMRHAGTVVAGVNG